MSQIATARMLLKKPGYWKPDGEFVLTPDDLTDWASVPVHTQDTCEHTETICVTCAPSWAIDWFMHPEDHMRFKGDADPGLN